jgi:hypothetical protein
LGSGLSEKERIQNEDDAVKHNESEDKVVKNIENDDEVVKNIENGDEVVKYVIKVVENSAKLNLNK